jgi:hypothetical protein
VGSWDLEVVSHRPDGSTETVPGEWHFAWVLGGYAVQDVWIAPSRAHRAAHPGHDEGEWGTTLRFYDPDLGAWRSTWVGPRRHVVRPFLARAEGDEIVLEARFEEGVLTRWIFFDVRPDTFRWRNVESDDDGATWRLLQEFWATRAAAS